ncbi:MAG: aldehyde ferredoxin oxidoreductase [Lentisphaerae bacterium]|jgi:aldehyde:ferredoxin oxidoreductase|nr:aldehyde ferredoxin oxidoreductase [Lentisphaerota bacterium]MBT4815898.1 aldehyde ferredoxin oxidoreductase [Lentisphaerota bacterium]MBT5609814.1 aldehyde ferredoxin oxidoreductase [Lentisphaerota bacterium]MBT7055132.1 aldehyde ferredoxin oxidoreductase [Lentisphaerota bacterium]MBT7846304.1 aldehyde ferredoxin oxidoreductase [Lentisphaerota bacterium]
MHGWTGTILHIDLTAGTHTFERPSPSLYETWLGGKGLAGYYLSPDVTRRWDAPEMPLILMTGPLVGTASPTSGRCCVMSRSPLTGTIGDTSVGGTLGNQLKRAGLDGIIVRGAGTRMCGVEIVDDTVVVVDAEDLRGTDTETCAARLNGKGATALIGPAAENGVRYASIMVDSGHAAGRNGLGLVFAAKNLKYMTVKGTGKVHVLDPDGLKQAREDVFRQIAASPVLLGELGIAQYGTGALYDLMDSRRMMPTANFRETVFDRARVANAAAYKERYAPKRTGCNGCHILCKKVTAEGTHLPEFETMSHFSALLGNDDIDIVTQANALCNRMGMDTISAAVTLACHAELTGDSISGSRILSLLEDIGQARGLGVELGRGSQRYAESQGEPELAMAVKGQELPAYDPRGAYGMALAYATSTRGGCHLRAYPISHEILRKPVATDRFSFAGKARIVKIAEDANAVVDSLTACKFVFFASSLEEFAKAYSAVTGVPSTAQDLLRIGERICYHERIMNARNGFSATDDDLPKRFFAEGGSSGNAIDIKPVDRDAFLNARTNYYAVRGLDTNGRPLPAKAGELGLELHAETD